MNVNPEGEVAQAGPMIADKMIVQPCSSDTTFLFSIPADVAEVSPKNRWTLGLDFA